MEGRLLKYAGPSTPLLAGITARPQAAAQALGHAITRLPPPPRVPAGIMNDIPPLKPMRSLGEMLKRAFWDELLKMGAISPEQARRSLDRLDSLESSSPTAGQLGRYGALGATAGALTKGVSGAIEHGHLPTGRALLGGAAAGAIGMGTVPLIRRALDRHSEIGTLKKFMGQEHAGTYAKNPPASPTYL